MASLSLISGAIQSVGYAQTTITTITNAGTSLAYFNMGTGSVTATSNHFPIYPTDTITIGLLNTSGISFVSTGSTTINISSTNNIW